MSDEEIQLLRQLDEDIKALQTEQQALQNQLVAILSANLTTTTALLNLLNCSHPRSDESRAVNAAVNSLRGLKSSIDRKLAARRK